MVTPEQHSDVIQAVSSSPLTGSRLRQFAMERLDALPDYDWSGIYRLEGNDLLLDAFVGADTDHVRIPVGVGVCGTAVAQDANQLIEDVRELANYLACSVSTRSEIVVLIRKNGEILGQIDIDSHRVGAFDDSDESLLEQLAELLAQRWRDQD